MKARSAFRYRSLPGHPSFRQNLPTRSPSTVHSSRLGPKHIFTNLKPAETLKDFLSRDKLSDFRRIFGYNIESLNSFPFSTSRRHNFPTKPHGKSLLSGSPVANNHEIVVSKATHPFTDLSLSVSEQDPFTDFSLSVSEQDPYTDLSLSDVSVSEEDPNEYSDSIRANLNRIYTPHNITLSTTIPPSFTPVELSKFGAENFREEKLHWQYTTGFRPRGARRPHFSIFEDSPRKTILPSVNSSFSRVVKPYSPLGSLFSSGALTIQDDNQHEKDIAGNGSGNNWNVTSSPTNSKSLLHPFTPVYSSRNDLVDSSLTKEIGLFSRDELKHLFLENPFLTSPNPRIGNSIRMHPTSESKDIFRESTSNFSSLHKLVSPNDITTHSLNIEQPEFNNTEESNFRLSQNLQLPSEETNRSKLTPDIFANNPNPLDPEFFLSDFDDQSRFQPEVGGSCITSFMDRGK